MSAKLRQWLEALGDLFWIRPALLVLGGVVLGQLAVLAEQTGLKFSWVPERWLYSGGESGARAMLGAIATSMIGVAGTVFSITVAALSLAANQMGPRLLRNFVRDSGNQYALGIFLATFAYSLVLLRSVRAVDEGTFVPYLGVSAALLLGLLCVATLVWFVHHVASSINIETVIGLVYEDLAGTVDRLCPKTVEEGAVLAPPTGTPLVLAEHGFLRAVDDEGLADWAAARGEVVVLLVRPGEYLFPGAAVALLAAGDGLGKDEEAAREAVNAAFSLGMRQAAAQDLEFAVRQLVEVAVRALSPGINDPFTAIEVLDRLGAALCQVAGRFMAGNTVIREGRVVLFRKVTDYAGLCDAMFHMIRRNAVRAPSVLIRMVEVLGRVLEVETRPERRVELARHVELALAAARIGFADPNDLAVLRERVVGVAGRARVAS